MGLVGRSPKQFDEEVISFIEFIAMKHATSLDQVPYKHFLKAFTEDYEFLQDKKSIWEKDGDFDFEPSSDEGELESEKSPLKS